MKDVEKKKKKKKPNNKNKKKVDVNEKEATKGYLLKNLFEKERTVEADLLIQCFEFMEEKAKKKKNEEK